MNWPVSSGVFKMKVRFIGAGTIGMAAVWTLLRVIGPIVKGITGAWPPSARKSGEGAALALTEQDLPIGIVGAVIVAAMIPIGLLLAGFAKAGRSSAFWPVLIRRCLCADDRHRDCVGLRLYGGADRGVEQPNFGHGHHLGLGIALLLAAFFGRDIDPAATKRWWPLLVRDGHRVWRGDHFQRQSARPEDRRTGRRDAVASAGGAGAGRGVRRAGDPAGAQPAQHAFGFVGAPGAGPEALAAPQAALISTIAQGVLGGSLTGA
jgi:hypothetical protein